MLSAEPLPWGEVSAKRASDPGERPQNLMGEEGDRNSSPFPPIDPIAILTTLTISKL